MKPKASSTGSKRGERSRHFAVNALRRVANARAVRINSPDLLCNEDDQSGDEAAGAAEACMARGASWGLMLKTLDQYFPLEFHGAADDPVVYRKVKELTTK